MTSPQASVSTSNSQKQAVLDRIIEAYKAYDSVAVFDRQGNLIVQSTGEPLDNQKTLPTFKTLYKKILLSSANLKQQKYWCNEYLYSCTCEREKDVLNHWRGKSRGYL